MASAYTQELFGLDGKTVVITGGGGTLGSAMGAALARAGANVILWDVRPEALAEKQERLAEACGEAARPRTCEVNLMEDASVAEALSTSVGTRATFFSAMNRRVESAT